MYDKEVQEVLDKLVIFEKMYDQIRLVDPIIKKVLSYKNNIVNELPLKCFDFWAKSKVCNNCVSIRAFNENKTFVKVEYTPNEIYIVTAVPVELSNRRIVIELLKNTTDSMVFRNGNENNDNNSEIYEMIDSMNNLGLKDSLTGIYNRRYINEKLPIELTIASLSEQSLSIIMIDIDFFKKVNDTYGHLTGDCILKNFADTLLAFIKRESDWVSRYGGEEFIICLPGAGLEKAIEIAEHIRRTVENNAILCREHTINITASFGVCSIKPTPGASVENLIECADKKLYAAKNNGRNRVES